MFCQKCGAENATEAKFCKGCGSPMGSINQSFSVNNHVTTPINRPDKVTMAVNLLWASLGVAVLQLAVSASSFGSYLSMYIIPIGFFSVAFSGFFIYMIGEGRDWARIISSLFFVIGFLFYAGPVFQMLMVNPFLGSMGIGQLAAQAIAYAFLFQKPSSDWFNSMKLR